MGLNLWFREDCARILAATQETMAVTMNATPALDPAQAEAYRRGFSDAIRAVAIAFGLTAPISAGDNGPQMYGRPKPETVSFLAKNSSTSSRKD